MKPITLEEHCTVCNRPIYEGDGRYRIPGETVCETCGDETREKRQSGVIL